MLVRCSMEVICSLQHTYASQIENIINQGIPFEHNKIKTTEKGLTGVSMSCSYTFTDQIQAARVLDLQASTLQEHYLQYCSSAR